MKGFLSKLLVGLFCSTIVMGSGVSFGASIESITVYEMTGPRVPYWFAITDPRLIETIDSVGPDGCDFPGVRLLSNGKLSGSTWEFGSQGEFYDAYISDSDGTPNPNGMYLTIDCFRNLHVTGPGAAHNIDAVSLDFTDGTHLWATEVTNYVLGYEQPLTIAQPENSLGQPDNQSTIMGDQFSSITVGFDLVGPIKADELEERVQSLESQVSGLEEQNSLLQQEIADLIEMLENCPITRNCFRW